MVMHQMPAKVGRVDEVLQAIKDVIQKNLFYCGISIESLMAQWR
jgi:hypothetical protein